MSTCTQHDSVVVYTTRNCPACDLQDELDFAHSKIDELESKIEELEKAKND